jgi:pantoate--beta-alanine ligase
MTQVIDDPRAFQAACEEARRAGKVVGIVPTMGALHAGHLALVDEARRRGATHLVVTIFVNPLQFGPTEDFGRYPRTFDEDRARCEEAGVDVIFAPSREAMYPEGFATTVHVADLTERLEGVHRRGHFDGVTTVVAKLFSLVGPSVAAFGRKDYQQWRVLSKMVEDLHLPIEMHGMATVREPDGLAMSSRNRYLSAEDRPRALGIVRGLRAAHAAFAAGERESAVLEELARAPIAEAFDSVDYVTVADPLTLRPHLDVVGDRALVAVAAHLGKTRLIDNTVLGEEPSP